MNPVRLKEMCGYTSRMPEPMKHLFFAAVVVELKATKLRKMSREVTSSMQQHFEKLESQLNSITRFKTFRAK